MSDPITTPPVTTPPGGNPTSELMAGLLPEAPAASTPATLPAAEPPQPAGDYDWIAEGATAPAAPAAGEASPPASPEASPEASQWTPDRFISEKIGNPSDFLTGEDKITQFGQLRDLAGNALKENQALQLQLAQLQVAGVKPGESASPIPESEAIATLKAQLETQTSDANSWQEQKARNELSQNTAFRREHDAPRARILRELGAAAKEVELEDGQVQEFLGLSTEYKQAKWIEENVDDDTAATLFKEKGGNFLSLSIDRSDAINSDDPFATIQDWEEREAAFGNKVAANLDNNIARQFQAAAVKKFEELTGPNGDLYFKTDSGKGALAEISKRFSDGIGVSPEEMVDALAHRGSGEAYKGLSKQLAEKLTLAEKENRRLRGLDPSSSMLGVPATPTTPPAAGEGDDPFYTGGGASGAIKPLISEEGLAAAIGRGGF